MNTPLLWFGLMPPGGTGNIFIEMAVRRNRKRLFVEPCPLTIGGDSDHFWPYIYKCVPYVNEIETSFNVGWRSMPWENHSDVLLAIVNRHAPAHTWAASFDTSTFQAVKKIFKDSCLTVSINYTEDDFEFMKSKWVRWQTGLVMQNSKYNDFKNRFSNSREIENYLKNHGSTEFGYELLKSKNSSADIEIPLRDLFVQSRLADILDYLDTQPTSKDWDFYNLYCRASG